jgi:hypothetical protein
MGFFKALIKDIIKEAKFIPDFSKTEYENWLDFIDKGGTSEEWNKLISVNNWCFKEDIYQKYQKEVKEVSDNYFYLLPLIQREWSVLHNLNQFNGQQAKEFEKMCLQDISYYIKMRNINLKYNEKSPLNVPAFTRLAMLYEKQEEFEKSAVICKEACILGIDERSRLLRMLKKAGRTPTAEENAIIESNF